MVRRRSSEDDCLRVCSAIDAREQPCTPGSTQRRAERQPAWLDSRLIQDLLRAPPVRPLHLRRGMRRVDVKKGRDEQEPDLSPAIASRILSINGSSNTARSTASWYAGICLFKMASSI